MKKKFLVAFSMMLTIISAITIIYNKSNSHEQIISNDKFTYKNFAKEILNENECDIMPEFTSENTIGLKNKDGIEELYVFARPINYLDENNEYRLIDDRIENVSDPVYRDMDYLYKTVDSDILSYYPSELSDDKGIFITGKFEYSFGVNCKQANSSFINRYNFINKKTNMILYENAFENSELYVYSSAVGTNCEMYFKNNRDNIVTFWIDFTNSNIVLEKAGGDYLTINDRVSNEVLGVVQLPILKDKYGNVSYRNNVTFRSCGEGKYEIVFLFESKYINEGSTAFLSFECRKEKQADNALYEKKPDLVESFLKNYSVVGNSDDLGIGQVLTRFNFVDKFDSILSRLENAYYYLYSITEIKNEYEIVSMDEEWCSITGNWNSYYKSGDVISTSEKENGHLIKFELGGEICKWRDNHDLEKYGIKLKAADEKKEDYNVILSNDNTLFNNRLKIEFRNED